MRIAIGGAPSRGDLFRGSGHLSKINDRSCRGGVRMVTDLWIEREFSWMRFPGRRDLFSRSIRFRPLPDSEIETEPRSSQFNLMEKRSSDFLSWMKGVLEVICDRVKQPEIE